MLRRLMIKKYKSVYDNTIEPGRTNVLIGNNGFEFESRGSIQQGYQSSETELNIYGFLRNHHSLVSTPIF